MSINLGSKRGNIIKTGEVNYGTLNTNPVYGSVTYGDNVLITHNSSTYNMVNYKYDNTNCLVGNPSYYKVINGNITNLSNYFDKVVGVIGADWELIYFKLPDTTIKYFKIEGTTSHNLKNYLINAIKVKDANASLDINFTFVNVFVCVDIMYFFVQYRDYLERNNIYVVKTKFTSTETDITLSNNFTLSSIYNLYKMSKKQGETKNKALEMELRDIAFDNENLIYLLTTTSTTSYIWYIKFLRCLGCMLGTALYNLPTFITTTATPLSQIYAGISSINGKLIISTINKNDGCPSESGPNKVCYDIIEVVDII